MMREALQFEREQTQSEKVFDRALRAPKSPRPEQQRYTSQIQKILSDIGYTKRAFAPPDMPLKAMVDGSDGQLAVADWLTDGSKLPASEDMTVQQVRDLRKSIDSLAHVGKQEQILSTAFNKATVENAARDIAQLLRSI